MKKCKHCQVEVLDHTFTCPLCKRVLSDDGEEDARKFMYPDVDFDKKKFSGIKNLFFALSGMLAVTMILINYLTYNGFLWSVIVLASVIYLIMTVSYSVVHHANPAAKIVVETLGGGVLVFVIDYFTGNYGWSVDYAIPGLIIIADLAIVVLMIVNRMNWYSYVMYQIIIAILSLIPLILSFIGNVRHPVVVFVSSGISILIFILTMTFGNKSGKNELMRRFHT